MSSRQNKRNSKTKKKRPPRKGVQGKVKLAAQRGLNNTAKSNRGQPNHMVNGRLLTTSAKQGQVLPSMYQEMAQLTSIDFKKYGLKDGVRIRFKAPFAVGQYTDGAITNTWLQLSAPGTLINDTEIFVSIPMNPTQLFAPGTPVAYMSRLYSRFMFETARIVYEGSYQTTSVNQIGFNYTPDGGSLEDATGVPATIFESVNWPNTMICPVWLPSAELDISSQLNTTDLFYMDYIVSAVESDARVQDQGNITVLFGGSVPGGASANFYGVCYLEGTLILSNLSYATSNITLARGLSEHKYRYRTKPKTMSVDHLSKGVEEKKYSLPQFYEGKSEKFLQSEDDLRPKAVEPVVPKPVLKRFVTMGVESEDNSVPTPRSNSKTR